MSRSSFKRIKHGHTPGDIGKSQKIEFREKPSRSTRAKSFNKQVVLKTKAVLKERTRREIERGLYES